MYETVKTLLKRFPPLFHFIKWVYAQLVRVEAYFKWAALQKKGTIKLELGSARKHGTDGWTTVDLHGADINCNLFKGIPLADGTVDAIYSSHLLEHIPYRQLIPFIAECKRVLKKGGYFSVCVPNAGFYIRAYAEGKYFKDPKTGSFHLPAIVDTGSLLDQVNYVAYMDETHCYLFDEENLINTLKKGGFENAKPRSFDDTLDTPEHDHESIYAIAVK